MGLRLVLTGGFLSGKSTIARELERRGFVYINYTDHLKELAVIALGALGIHVTVEEIHLNKEKYRPFLIELGTLLGFDQGNYVDEVIAKHGNPERAVFDNVRFDPQMDKLLKYDYQLVRIEVPDLFRMARAAERDIDPRQFEARTKAVTERGLSLYPNQITVQNIRPVEDVVDEILHRARWGLVDSVYYSGGLDGNTTAA